MNTPFIFRGVGGNQNPTNNYYGGKFFADNPMDASNYGDTIEVYSLSNAKLYYGECSIEYCKQKELLFHPYPIIFKLSNRNFTCLDDVLEELILLGDDPNLGLAIFQAIARIELEKEGYQGAEWTWEDELIPHQYQIWDESVITPIEVIGCAEAYKKY